MVIIGECVVCRQEKETRLATVHAYEEEGQDTPFLKIAVCQACLKGKKPEPSFKKGMDL